MARLLDYKHYFRTFTST